jgi:hypothetical protein
MILSLSSTLGMDTGDLPPFALLPVAAGGRGGHSPRSPGRLAGRWARAASALVLGALLLAGVVDNDVAKPPLPAGGGTFDGTTQHADARQAESVNRWSHVALTYDGKALRLYENAIQVSSRAETGSILRTTDPL